MSEGDSPSGFGLARTSGTYGSLVVATLAGATPALAITPVPGTLPPATLVTIDDKPCIGCSLQSSVTAVQPVR